jgi:hypothetical protein
LPSIACSGPQKRSFPLNQTSYSSSPTTFESFLAISSSSAQPWCQHPECHTSSACHPAQARCLNVAPYRHEFIPPYRSHLKTIPINHLQ